MNAAYRAAKSLWVSTPLLLGVVLLIGLTTLIPREFITTLFNDRWFDPIVGATIGAVLAGNPVTSYVLGGELLAAGVGLTTVTAFIVAWVTVGIVQLPAEGVLLGRRFALTRNAYAFISAIIIAIIMGVLL